MAEVRDVTESRYGTAMALDLAGGFFGGLLVAVWVVGQISEPDFTGKGLDYIFEPPAIPGWVIVALGLTGLVALGAIAVTTRRQPMMPIVFISSTFAGLLAGFGYRLVTAGGGGANIGGGVALIVIPPIVVEVLVAVGALAVAKRPKPTTAARPNNAAGPGT